MTWKRNVLVVANVTATSDELLSTLRERADSEPMSFELIIPATPFGGGAEAASEQLQEALARLAEAGLEARGGIGHGDPLVAVTDTWDPKTHDEIIVSTLPMRFSKWMSAGLPQRISRVTGAPVTHVVAQPPKPPVPTTAPPARDESSAAMGPLAVLAWGGQKHH
jgi:hypothetical protein